MALINHTDITAVPLRGGCNTRVNKALLPFGAFSMVQNINPKHPGFDKRAGQAKLHTTADSTNEVFSIYQFRKQRIDESHFLAQMSDGDVLDATASPPTVTTGVFGAEVYSGTGTGEVPAAWGNLNDIMLYSNGVDQHQTYAGNDNYVSAFIVYDGSAAPANVPEKGKDYTTEVSDNLATTVAILDSLDTYANFECVFICTPVSATKLTWTIPLPNGTVSTATLYYRKNDNTWASTGMTDGTKSGSTTLATTGGAMTWANPSDEIPMYMYGLSGFWYQLRVSVQLDSEVEVSKVTYGHYASNTPVFVPLVNVWDGLIPYAIEAMHYDNSAGLYKTYATGSVNIRLMEQATGALGVNDDKDRLYFSTPDPIVAIYVDVGNTPNTATTAIVAGVKGWTGAAFTTVGTITDGTNGLTNSGWITWPRLATIQPTQFKTSQWYSYWYYFWIGTAALSSSVTISIYTMPYFDIEDLGRGLCNCVWKDMVAYSFTNYSNYVYVTAPGSPTALNGDSFGILKAGDGRPNKVVAMRKFYNELLAFQQEKGVEGGSVTRWQGYSPTTFGKVVISSTIGTFSNKTVAVVDGVMTSTETGEDAKTLCFFLSRYGVCVTDGLTVSIISDDIQNYFDPNETECIRRGYEDKHWLNYDSARNCVLMGLVSGSSATLPNVFPVFDLTDKCWYFDNRAQELSCMIEVEAGSGALPVLQVGGGIDDGTVYLLNTGTNDVTTAIDSYATMELNARGEHIQLNEMLLRMEAQGAGNVTITFSKNSISDANVANLITSWTNTNYDSFTSVASPNITSAVYSTSGTQVAQSAAFTTTIGVLYKIVATWTNVAGQAPTLFGSSEVPVTLLSSGVNTIYFYAATISTYLSIRNTAAASWGCTFVLKQVSASTPKELSMIAEVANQSIRRHRFNLNFCDQNLSCKIQHNTASQSCGLLDVGFRTQLYKER